MVDLFCGRGGWSKGFMAQGWTCRGYDLKPQPDYPAEFLQADICSLTLVDIADADFVCCSSPCEQFSVHCMKHFHPNPPFPAKGIELFERGRFLCGDKPHVMENVRCAERFVGRSVNHCGPFYLWGNAVPATLHREMYELRKKEAFRGMPGTEYEAALKSGLSVKGIRNAYQKERERRAGGRRHTPAAAAEIPLSLSTYIAQCATRLVGGGAWIGERLGSGQG